MDSIEDMRKLAPEVALQMLKQAKGPEWTLNWRPHCKQTQIPCTSGLHRMDKTDYGFRCRFCGNVIGFHLERLSDSPLNNPDYKPGQTKKYF